MPWTTSRVVGTPDPALPYVAVLAFPKLHFDRPVLLTFAPDTDRLYVAEVAGKVLSFANDPKAERADLVIDLARARPGATALYGMAFHPRHEENGYVYLCYVLEQGKPDATRVSRFTIARTDPPTIDPASEKVLITWLSGGHNAGCLAFGPDGNLYISTGDAADPSPPDPLKTGQDLSDLLSSILRIDVDHQDPGRPYRVPPDNPFLRTPGARPEVWAYGFRNPWRMSFDRNSGDLWVGDVGWELWEMIDRVEKGGNYGWSIVEGHQPIRTEGQRGPTPILPPTIEHPHSEAASITGGYVYRGSRLKELAGVYIYGDYQSGKVWGLRHDGKQVIWRAELADTGLRLVSFGDDRSGEIYLVEHERSNQIYRLAPNPAPKPQHDFPRTLGQTGLFTSTKDHTPAPGVLRYSINAPMWSDGTQAERWMAIPGMGRIDVNPEGFWKLPEGTVLARTVTLDLVAGDPKSRRRLETQMLHFEQGSWRPYTYIWNDDQTDAMLAEATGVTRTFLVRDDKAPGGRIELAYRFAARSECVLCHNPWVEARTTVFGRQSASPLALSTPQLNRDAEHGENQIRRLERLGYFAHPVSEGSPPRLVDPYDEKSDLDARARSYLQVNCSHCHQFNAGGAATITLSAGIPLDKMNALDARPIQGTFGIDDARIIAPGEPERSVLLYRISKTGPGRMPRVGSLRVDEKATRLIGDWIALMPKASGRGPALTAEELRALKTLQASPASDGRGEAIRCLTASTRSSLALLRLVDGGKVPAPTLREIVARAKDSPRPEVRDLFERFIPDAERVKRLGDAIDPAALLALRADVARGRQWFRSESATQCQTCHRAEGVGTELGPDLSQIGSKYGKADLLRHILEPSREIDPRYATASIATKDGKVYSGLIAEKTAREVVLRDAKNQAIRIPVEDIEQQATQSTSLMPEGVLRDLTAQQAADLLEYLSSLKKP